MMKMRRNRSKTQGIKRSMTVQFLCVCWVKLWTDRPYNMYGLFETMKKLWNPLKCMICRDMGANLLSFQFNSKRDMERVISMEPWPFNKHVLVLSPISNDVQTSQIQFNKYPFGFKYMMFR